MGNNLVKEPTMGAFFPASDATLWSAGIQLEPTRGFPHVTLVVDASCCLVPLNATELPLRLPAATRAYEVFGCLVRPRGQTSGLVRATLISS
jgi:hypothetical protein